jgi:hypothetical protein
MDEAEAEHHPQQAKGDASLPAVEQSKARHDEDAEEGPTNHSSPPSSPSLDQGTYLHLTDDHRHVVHWLTPQGQVAKRPMMLHSRPKGKVERPMARRAARLA